ncbi:unnamed protein product [Closterium sp. NIES-65]|nr:unnamed protein product [Closterium sp. NIES-65]
MRRHLPTAERVHFSQYKSAKTFRSALRLPLAGDAAPTRARGARALEGLAGAVEVVVEAVEGVGVVEGVVAGVEVSVAAVEAEEAAAEAEGAEEAVVAEAAEVAEAAAAAVALVAALRKGVVPVVVRASSSSAVVRPCPLNSFVSGTLGVSEPCFGHLTDAWHHQFPDATKIPRWGELTRAGVAIFDLDYDAILVAMYAMSNGDEGDCYLCVPPNPGIEATVLGAGEAAALVASASAAPGAGESALSGLYLPSFSTNLVSGADIQDGGVDQFTSARQRVAALSQVFAAASRSGPESAPCSCRLLSHQTLLWHHRLGHPSLPRLRGMASRVLVSGLPRSLPPLHLGPAPTCVPCVEGRKRAAPHSSEFPPTEAPLQTLHMDLLAMRLRFVSGDLGRLSATCPRTSCPPRAVPCIFVGFPPDVPGWQFYHPTSRRVLSSQDVTFDESVPYYRLFPYRTAPLPPPPLFLAPGPPSVDPLPPQGPAPSGVSQVDAVELVEVAVDSGAAGGAEPAGAGSGGVEPGGAEPGGAESRDAEPRGVESGCAESGGAEPGGTEPGGAEPGGVGRATRAGGATVAAGPGGARPNGTGAARTWGAAGIASAGRTTIAAGVTGAAGPAGVGAAGAARAGAAGGVGTRGTTGARASEGAGAGAIGAGGAAGADASEGARVGAVGGGGATGAGTATWVTGTVLAV